MKPGVTKQQLVKSLEETLKLTRENIDSLELATRHEPEDTGRLCIPAENTVPESLD